MQKPACPKCQQTKPVEKVSTIYMLGIGAGRLPKLAGLQPVKETPAGQPLTAIPEKDLVPLSRRLSPPAGGRPETIRPVHPDWIVVAFTLILPLFLVQIARQQPGTLPYIIGFVFITYGLYFWQRKTLIGRYERQIEARLLQAKQVESAIGRWMKAYYCTDDDIVFEAGRTGWAPADQLQELLTS